MCSTFAIESEGERLTTRNLRKRRCMVYHKWNLKKLMACSVP